MQRNDFTKMVLEHQGRIRLFIRMLGATPDAVDDLAQDVFVIAYERIEMLEDLDESGPWLRAIARNLVRNEMRKSTRRRRLVSSSITEVMLAVAEEPVADNANEDWFAALKTCMDKLPQHGRQLVDGRYRKGQNASQLADQTDTTPAAVRQALTRFRTLLRQCVEARLQQGAV